MFRTILTIRFHFLFITISLIHLGCQTEVTLPDREDVTLKSTQEVSAMIIAYYKDAYGEKFGVREIEDDFVVLDVSEIKILQPVQYAGKILRIIVMDSSASKILNDVGASIEFSLELSYLVDDVILGDISSYALFHLRRLDTTAFDERGIGTGN